MTPRGPLALPPGGAHWYSVREIGFPGAGTFWPTYELLGGWLDALLAEHDGAGRPQPAGVVALQARERLGRTA